MILVDPSFTIEHPVPFDRKEAVDIYCRLEQAGRTCYKSEDRISRDSSVRFVRNIVKRGHLSVIEHASVTVRIVHSRGFSHELVRHRLASFSQESTRYCNYGKAGHVTFIRPRPMDTECNAELVSHLNQCEQTYLGLIRNGIKPEIARCCLPLQLKTEIVITANLREWLHIFELRTSPLAHPDMRDMMTSIQARFVDEMPEIFGGQTDEKQ